MMKEFMLLFRAPDVDYSGISPKEVAAWADKWQQWVQGIEAQDRLANRGLRLAQEGRVLKPGGVVTDGPFVEIRERLGGFMVVRAEDLEEATSLAHGCPALEFGGSVEIRPFYE